MSLHTVLGVDQLFDLFDLKLLMWLKFIGFEAVNWIENSTVDLK